MPLPTILSGNVATALGGAFEVANSCRFNGGEYMHKSLSATATHADKCTFSIWVKPQVSDSRNTFIAAGVDSGNYMKVRLQDDKLAIYGNRSSQNDLHVVTNRLFRDPSAFYHILLQVDTTQSTSTDRVKFFVNGVQETSMSTTTYMAQNADCFLNGGVSSSKLFIGAFDTAADGGVSEQGEGYFAEVALIDGSILAPTEFGEYDEDSPTIWKPKDISGLTFGANGFYLDFEDSSNLGNDANGGTDLTEVNLAAIDQSIDTPTNNFPVINILNNMVSAHMVITDGNLHKHNQPTNNYWRSIYATMGASSGKWYFEMLMTNDEGSDVGNMFIGIVDADQMDNHLTSSAHYKFVTRSRGYGYFGQNGNKDNNASSSSFGDSWGNGDRLGCAFDLDNGKIYFSKNGTWQNSGDPTSGSTGTGSAFDVTTGYTYLPVIGVHYGNSQMDLNFGSPIAAISSGNADGDGYGNFEYAVPSGYYALCTKNLAEYG